MSMDRLRRKEARAKLGHYSGAEKVVAQFDCVIVQPRLTKLLDTARMQTSFIAIAIEAKSQCHLLLRSMGATLD
jgi:hypothetical protein